MLSEYNIFAIYFFVAYMKNITGKIIKSAANHLNSLDKKINFPVPKRVVNYLGKD
jgi:hypothetical protein